MTLRKKPSKRWMAKSSMAGRSLSVKLRSAHHDADPVAAVVVSDQAVAVVTTDRPQILAVEVAPVAEAIVADAVTEKAGRVAAVPVAAVVAEAAVAAVATTVTTPAAAAGKSI